GLFHRRVAVPGQSQWSAHYEDIETQIGRWFDIVKNYTDWEQGRTFPDAADRALADGGRIIYYSWNAVNYSTHSKVSYQAIANGTFDRSVIIPEARALKNWPYKVFIDFDHEPDTKAQAGKGTPAQYVAAYRHIHDVLQAHGVKNVIWSWVTTGYVPHRTQILASYPGAAYVNWISYDPYNFAQCLDGDWHSTLDTFKPFYDLVTNRPGMARKPLMLAEYATAPGAQAQAWYASVPATLRLLPRIKAVMEFDATSAVPCALEIDKSAAAFAGFKQASTTPYVLGTGP
ncbi:MAG: hypothetical protein JO214_11370, partial [Frankiaceae bacterium]|nr:hypothetical protein [Frankiaceae bacterium]